ncbi:MAG: M14 family zinc carboxypeptidase [Acidobacteriota bacterium]
MNSSLAASVVAALLSIGFAAGAPQGRTGQRQASQFNDIPPEYLVEPHPIPDFWVSTVEGVNRFLDTQVKKGSVRAIGKTAGGRPIRAVFYGHPRKDKGTTTFSGSLGFGDVRAYLGPDYEKKVFLALASVHGGEFEGIVGMVNFLAVLETGRDLRGKQWPEIVSVAKALHRIIVVPIVNVDGRARIPLRMIRFSENEKTALNEYFNTGAWRDGSNIGWPECKAFIPLDFSRTQFPGGYPNDAGINIQHDDFFSPRRQPETQALFELAAQERPDLILNMHAGGAPFMRANRSFIEPELMPIFDRLYRQVQGRLTTEKLQGSDDVSLEADPAPRPLSGFNLDSALNLHCGTLTVIFEAPSHTYPVKNRKGERVVHKPDDILDAELVVRQETMKFLAETGGRFRWAQK